MNLMRALQLLTAHEYTLCMQVFSMDIHPQAKFGKGILMDHGTGIVIGQTAEIGNNVSILQNVTLGGNSITFGQTGMLQLLYLLTLARPCNVTARWHAQSVSSPQGETSGKEEKGGAERWQCLAVDKLAST